MSKEVEGNPLRLMKIFKLFVCLSLILSISLVNSFAAISVSDGSAFVTKAEFAADLNNLSNRMSSLENSLDAKIDSLVSSYLSRNGIWNGEKQEILSYKDGSIWVNRWAKNTVGNETVINDSISICKINKSGLGNFKFNIRSNNDLAKTTASFGTIFLVKSNFTVTSDTAKAIISFRYDVIDEKSSIVFSKLFYSITFNSTNHVREFNGFLPSYNFDDFFFVEKDKKLSLRLVVISEGSNFSTSWFTKNISATPYLNPILKIESLVVY